MTKAVHIIGAGLAGSEAACRSPGKASQWSCMKCGWTRRTDAHHTGFCAELVCSNSFRSDDPQNAVGLLHAEMRAAGSLILSCADAHQVPAGAALAVDRDGFAEAVTNALTAHPLIQIARDEVA